MTLTPDTIHQRIAELQAKNEAHPEWGAAVEARCEEIKELERKLRRLERHTADSLSRPFSPETLQAEHNTGVLHDDLLELMELAGVDQYARPCSPHDVFQECIARLRERLSRPVAQERTVREVLGDPTKGVDVFSAGESPGPSLLAADPVTRLSASRQGEPAPTRSLTDEERRLVEDSLRASSTHEYNIEPAPQPDDAALIERLRRKSRSDQSLNAITAARLTELARERDAQAKRIADLEAALQPFADEADHFAGFDKDKLVHCSFAVAAQATSLVRALREAKTALQGKEAQGI